MNSGQTAQRVHETLKARILAREFRPGERLDPTHLASTLASSVTPVRDALHLLTGEGLVESRTGGGFHMPALDEPALRDRYEWASELLMLALRNSSASCPRPDAQLSGGSIATRVSELFLLIAMGSRNGEHRRATDRLNARLHAVRLVEPMVLDRPEEELAELEEAFLTGAPERLRRLVQTYHRRRSRAAAGIVRALYRADA
jgi:DNA-binding transcriptional regulator YhcF (GntR family)